MSDGSPPLRPLVPSGMAMPVARLRQTIRRAVVWPEIAMTMTLLAVMALAAYMRLSGLGAEPFWMDEGYTMAYTQPPFFRMIEYIATRDVHPPLYYIFMKAWRSFGDSEAFLRLPSAVFGIAAAGVMWSTVREHYGIVAAAAAALLLATSESAIWYSQEARMYSLVLLLTVLTVKYSLRFLRSEPTARDAWGLGISTALLLYTHNVVVFFWAAQLLAGGVAVIAALARRKWSRRHKLWLAAQGAALIAYIPWIFILLRQSASVDERFWVGLPDGGTVASVFSIALAWRVWMAQQPAEAQRVIAAVPAVVALKTFLSLRDGRGFALLAMAFVPIAGVFLYSVLVTPIMVDRTLIFVSIPLLALVASFLSMPSRDARPLAKAVAAVRGMIGAVMVASLVWVNVQAWSSERRVQTKEDFRQAATAIRDYLRPGTAVVFNNSASQAAFDFYLHKLKGHESVEEYGVPCHYLEVPKGEANLEPLVTQGSIDRLHARIKDADRVVLVRSHQHYSDPGQLLLGYFSSNWRFLENLSTNGVEVYIYAKGWGW